MLSSLAPPYPILAPPYAELACFIRFRALPALNHSICSELKEWFTLISKGAPPSTGVTTNASGLPSEKVLNPLMETLEQRYRRGKGERGGSDASHHKITEFVALLNNKRWAVTITNICSARELKPGESPLF